MIGIYKITNLINGKVYIGQSVDISRRWRQHRNNYQVDDVPLYRAFRKYGISNFSFTVIEECSKEELSDRELYWIQYYNSYKEGYNATLETTVSGHVIKLSEEDVSNIISDLKNTLITQKELAKKYNVGEDTISEINQGKTRIRIGIEYPIRQTIKTTTVCPTCGGVKCREATQCNACAKKAMRLVERPDRETLKHKIRTESFLSIGREYGVSDNAIRRWCKTYNLPTKKKDVNSFSDEEWDIL